MRTLLRKTWAFVIEEDGPTAVEYAILLGLIILVCIVAITSLGTKTNTLMNSVVEQGGLP